MDLKQLAKNKGVEFIDKGNGHIQLKGKLLVNYYPNSKFKTAYIAGTTGSRKNTTPEKAIEMTYQVPKLNGKVIKRSGNSRKKRKLLIKKGVKQCHWCEKPLTLDNSTLEHIIPLAIGGLDNANNRTLACEQCNSKRGCKMPELKTLTNRET
jgi:5-methylcytosine-specific restriction endonuclease McrA